ncbi:hypothetical protein [Erythrobacter sp.]|uniref:hypothetical protein n=1 Tax=Erythrobacter sp. TaxID=1042 RepID=UPI0025EAFFF2|nr:hypothetical protein [Erythrobacter sp.]
MTRLSAPVRPLVTSLAAALALAVGMPAAAQGQSRADVETDVAAEPATKGEKRLAELLEGREAGEPVRCIRTLPSQRMQTIDKTAYVFGSGNTIYVQRTRDPEDIDDTDALVTRRFNGSQLCRLDVITTVDPLVGMFTGAVFFEDFVPYTRVENGSADRG